MIGHDHGGERPGGVGGIDCWHQAGEGIGFYRIDDGGLLFWMVMVCRIPTGWVETRHGVVSGSSEDAERFADLIELRPAQLFQPLFRLVRDQKYRLAVSASLFRALQTQAFGNLFANREMSIAR